MFTATPLSPRGAQDRKVKVDGPCLAVLLTQTSTDSRSWSTEFENLRNFVVEPVILKRCLPVSTGKVARVRLTVVNLLWVFHLSRDVIGVTKLLRAAGNKLRLVHSYGLPDVQIA